MRAQRMSMARRRVISVAGQDVQRGSGSQPGNDGPPLQRTAQTTVNDGQSSAVRMESSMRKESADIKEFSKTGNKAKIMEILTDNKKFQAHIKEIDIAFNNGLNISELTNIFYDDIDCKTVESIDKALTDMNISGPIVEEMLDQGPNAKGCLDSGPVINNPNSRTWKRIITGPKVANPNSEENHAGSKRGTQNHAKNEMNTTLKKKKTETEVAEVSRLMAIEFTEKAMAARQYRQDQ